MTVDSAAAAEQQAEKIQATQEEKIQSADLVPDPNLELEPKHKPERRPETGVEQQPPAKSALQASIEEKRERSYYYAHAPRSTSDEPAPPPVPVILERMVVEVPPAVVSVFNYAWADEGEVVKVYIPLEGVGSKCGDDDIKATFEARLMQVDVHGFKPKQVLRLLVPKLSGDITPAECRVRRLANKVVVSLKKAPGGSHKWYNLRGV